MITVEVNKQEEEKPNDIFYGGNYVISNFGGIVLVSGNGEDVNSFSGIIIKSTIHEGYNGDYSKRFPKGCYTQFTGTITITSK